MYRIPAANLEGLKADIEKLNKRALKLGTEPIHFAVTEWVEVHKKHQATGAPYTERLALVEIVGATPKLDGYAFQAKIEPTPAGNLVKLMPGVENVPERFYHEGMICDHCGLDRRRNECFVVLHEPTGIYAQVGRTCLADFLGGTSPERLANLAEWLADIREMGEGASGSRGVDPGEPTLAYVSTVAAFARHQGYVSKKQVEFSGGQSTGSVAWMFLRPSGTKSDEEWRRELEADGFKVEERDIMLAVVALDWASNLSPRFDNNFEQNMKVAASLEWADHKTVGILAALVGSYLRWNQRQLEEKAKAAQALPSQHMGQIGDRLIAEVTITGVRTFDGDYGVRTLVSMMTASGNVLNWWTGAQPDWVGQGVKTTVKGTVKKHDDYRGTAQTVLTRCTEVAS